MESVGDQLCEAKRSRWKKRQPWYDREIYSAGCGSTVPVGEPTGEAGISIAEPRISEPRISVPRITEPRISVPSILAGSVGLAGLTHLKIDRNPGPLLRPA